MLNHIDAKMYKKNTITIDRKRKLDSSTTASASGSSGSMATNNSNENDSTAMNVMKVKKQRVMHPNKVGDMKDLFAMDDVLGNDNKNNKNNNTDRNDMKRGNKTSVMALDQQQQQQHTQHTQHTQPQRQAKFNSLLYTSGQGDNMDPWNDSFYDDDDISDSEHDLEDEYDFYVHSKLTDFGFHTNTNTNTNQNQNNNNNVIRGRSHGLFAAQLNARAMVTNDSKKNDNNNNERDHSKMNTRSAASAQRTDQCNFSRHVFICC